MHYCETSYTIEMLSITIRFELRAIPVMTYLKGICWGCVSCFDLFSPWWFMVVHNISTPCLFLRAPIYLTHEVADQN